MRSFHERCIALQNENGQKLLPLKSRRRRRRTCSAKGERRIHSFDMKLWIRLASIGECTTIAGSTAARKRAASKRAFVEGL